MERIINMTEASAISGSDYIVIDSPTLGTRKYLAANLAGGGGGDTPWELKFKNGSINSAGWFYQTGSSFGSYLIIGTEESMSMYSRSSFECKFHIKTPTTIPNGEGDILGAGSALCSNQILFNADGTHKVTFKLKTASWASSKSLEADTEYIILFSWLNGVMSYQILNADESIYDEYSQNVSITYDGYYTTWTALNGNGSNKFTGGLYKPDSYVKVDDEIIW